MVVDEVNRVAVGHDRVAEVPTEPDRHKASVIERARSPRDLLDDRTDAAAQHPLSVSCAAVWLDEQRVVAVQPHPSFLPSRKPRETPHPDAGMNNGSDGTRTRDLRRDRPAL
jgi:hypothetical protein